MTSATTTEPAATATVAAEKAPRDLSWISLVITPVMALLLLVAMVWFRSTAAPDSIVDDLLETSKLTRQFREHLYLTAWSTVLVILIAVPLGIFITRPRFKRFANPILAVANSGQAIPAYGLLIIAFTWFGRGPRTAIIALTAFAILPVLRNTMVGLEQVDDAIIEAGRGMGMSRLGVLRKIELPLAVPVILAGVRTALVINVGFAALATFIGGGGFGETIVSGLKLRRDVATFVGAGIVALMALTIDWLAALAERYLRPKGI